MKELLIAEGSQLIADIMSHEVIYVATDTDQEEAARLLNEIDVIALPVVDRESRIVGIVTVDDAIDILEQEATEDMFNQAGLADVASNEADRSNVLINGNVWQIWKVRLPFLVITLIAGLLAGVVIDEFEQTLESVAAVAIFIPLIMDMGGNVGTQSSTVFVRGMSLGHIDLSSFTKYFFKRNLDRVEFGLDRGHYFWCSCCFLARYSDARRRCRHLIGLCHDISCSIRLPSSFCPDQIEY